MTVIEFQLPRCEGPEISWRICERVGDAIVSIRKKGFAPIDMTPMQCIQAISILADMAYEANVYNYEHGCMDLEGPDSA